MPTHLIDSILIPTRGVFDVYVQGEGSPLTILADTALFHVPLPDTLVVNFRGNTVQVQNPNLDKLRVQVHEADVFVTSIAHTPFVCLAKGKSTDGRLVIDSDTTSTLVLSDLHLTSQKGSAIYFPKRQKAIVEVRKRTTNTLSDAQYYQTDSTDTSHAALHSRGSLTIRGDGLLQIRGNSRNGIFSSKNVTVEDVRLEINDAIKNGIHCDRYKQESGYVRLHLSHSASKGIKTKKAIEIRGGKIEGEAEGNLIIAEGGTSHCTLLKSDGNLVMSGGMVSLQHLGQGGRCISVDSTLHITGGSLHLSCHGDGGSFLTASSAIDYYTPKCITADDSIFIEGGHIYCLSTGLGGKGIVAGKYLAIGTEKTSDSLIVEVTTTGECIVNDLDEDKRSGCPKGIKADEQIQILSGNIIVHTTGMGGEGVECNGEMFVRGGNLECTTFDDGINVGRSIEIAGGQVYCNSADNDGIDSNGSITISGGIVASVNQTKPNESFDAEDGQIVFNGGTVFGIGSMPVEVRESLSPFYTTPYVMSESLTSRGFILEEGKYICIQRGSEVIMALHNENKAFRSFITVLSPHFTVGEKLTICEGDAPSDPEQTFFNGRLMLFGSEVNTHPIWDIYVQTIQ